MKHHRQDEAEGVLVGLVGDLAGAPHLSLHLLLQPRVSFGRLKTPLENPHLSLLCSINFLHLLLSINQTMGSSSLKNLLRHNLQWMLCRCKCQSFIDDGNPDPDSWCLPMTLFYIHHPIIDNSSISSNEAFILHSWSIYAWSIYLIQWIKLSKLSTIVGNVGHMFQSMACLMLKNQKWLTQWVNEWVTRSPMVCHSIWNCIQWTNVYRENKHQEVLPLKLDLDQMTIFKIHRQSCHSSHQSFQIFQFLRLA